MSKQFKYHNITDFVIVISFGLWTHSFNVVRKEDSNQNKSLKDLANKMNDLHNQLKQNNQINDVELINFNMEWNKTLSIWNDLKNKDPNSPAYDIWLYNNFITERTVIFS